jgi:hypothetical protein
MIQEDLKPRRVPRYDLITGRMLKEMPRKGIVHLTTVRNSINTKGYFPVQLKVAQIIMITKPGKPLEKVSSYRPTSIFPIMSKFFKRLPPILEKNRILPDHQFGFRQRHSTIEPVHRITEIISGNLEKTMLFCGFVDITHAFDKMWHPGLLFKIRKILPHANYRTLQSYLMERSFQVKFTDEIRTLKDAKAVVLQESVLGSILYLISTRDLPTSDNTTATFADDTAILATHEVPAIASMQLQATIHKIDNWAKKWIIKINRANPLILHSPYATKPLRRCKRTILLYPSKKEVKYLGMHLDRKMTWAKHIKTKIKQLNLKAKQMNWLPEDQHYQ